MLMAVNVDKKPMVGLVAKSINEMFHHPKDMFWTGRVMDVLFDGIPIDCSSEAFEAKAACSVFQSGEVPAIKPVNDTHFSFSLFAAVSGGGRRVFAGIFGVVVFTIFNSAHSVRFLCRQTTPTSAKWKCSAVRKNRPTLAEWSRSMANPKWTCGPTTSATNTWARTNRYSRPIWIWPMAFGRTNQVSSFSKR